MSAVLENILREVKALSGSERQQLITALNASVPTPTEADREEQLLRQMEAEGIITRPKGSVQPFEPVECTGKPVSEIIIEERR